MKNLAIIKILGILLTMFSFTMLVPLIVAACYQDSSFTPYWLGFVITFVVGLVLWLPTSQHPTELKTRDGFLVVVLFWVVLSLFGSIPFIIATHPHVSFLDALFESVSGFTTTGASALPQLDHLPHALLYYRQQLQFIGGIGIVVLAVAILPMIGLGGMQLYRADTPGPLKDNKLTPRIMQTAKAVWMLYLSLFVICAIAYWLGGMKVFDAICEGFSTISTGGFGVHDSSFAYYGVTDHIICMVFMVLSGVNFALHYTAIVRRKGLIYWRDIECRTYFSILIIVSLITVASLFYHHYYASAGTTFLNGIFESISLITTTGFTTGSYNSWPSFLPVLLILFATIGACGGSTSGGIKVIRALLLQRQVSREVKQMVHPNAVYTIKIGDKALPTKLIEGIWAFVSVYLILFFIITLLLMTTGLGFESAFGSTVASLNNVGVGIGQYAYNFSGLTNFAKCIMMFGMLAGRLEVFTLLVIFSRSFWRK